MRQPDEQRYSMILTDPTFESRLKAFYPYLKLSFDQFRRRWCVLEWSPANQDWNVLIVAEEEDGSPKPLGEWVFNRLFVYRLNYERRLHNPNQYLDDLLYEADKQAEAIEAKTSADHMAQLSDERNEWRKAYRELNNLPTSDVTAGYRKVQ